MKMKDTTYDFLKWLCLVALPALSTFLGVILPGVGFEADTVTLIVTVISALIAFIGTLIGISTASYNNEKDGEK